MLLSLGGCSMNLWLSRMIIHLIISIFLTFSLHVVISTHENLALGKATLQSSMMLTAMRAVDGTLTHTAQYCAQTNREYIPWWAVYLEDIYTVHRVTIYNRKKTSLCPSCQKKLRGFQIHVGECPFCRDRLCFRDGGEDVDLPLIIHVTCDTPVTGTYLIISLEKTENLTLCEVEVYDYLATTTSSSFVAVSKTDLIFTQILANTSRVDPVSHTARDTVSSYIDDCLSTSFYPPKSCTVLDSPELVLRTTVADSFDSPELVLRTTVADSFDSPGHALSTTVAHSFDSPEHVLRTTVAHLFDSPEHVLRTTVADSIDADQSQDAGGSGEVPSSPATVLPCSTNLELMNTAGQAIPHVDSSKSDKIGQSYSIYSLDDAEHLPTKASDVLPSNPSTAIQSIEGIDPTNTVGIRTQHAEYNHSDVAEQSYDTNSVADDQALATIPPEVSLLPNPTGTVLPSAVSAEHMDTVSLATPYVQHNHSEDAVQSYSTNSVHDDQLFSDVGLLPSPPSTFLLSTLSADYMDSVGLPTPYAPHNHTQDAGHGFNHSSVGLNETQVPQASAVAPSVPATALSVPISSLLKNTSGQNAANPDDTSSGNNSSCHPCFQDEIHNETTGDFMSNILQSLTLDTKKVSNQRRRYISAPDDRVSSKTMGYLGVSVLVCVFGSIALVDLINFFIFLQKNISNAIKSL